MSAPEQLKCLHELQTVDQEIAEIERFRDSAPEQVKALEANVERHRLAVEEREAELKKLNETRRAKERELEEHEAHIRKNKERMNAVKTNEEYHAIQKENDAQRSFIEEFEDQILRIMDDIEGGELAVRKAKERYKEVEKKIRSQIEGITAELEKINERLETKKKFREQVYPCIDRLLLKRYEKLRAQTSGIAVARIIKGTCQGCHMNVPPQVYNLVIRSEEIITCPNCHRILYYEVTSGQVVG